MSLDACLARLVVCVVGGGGGLMCWRRRTRTHHLVSYHVSSRLCLSLNSSCLSVCLPISLSSKRLDTNGGDGGQDADCDGGDDNDKAHQAASSGLFFVEYAHSLSPPLHLIYIIHTVYACVCLSSLLYHLYHILYRSLCPYYLKASIKRANNETDSRWVCSIPPSKAAC
jgi:hypothetical protein